MYVQAKIKSAYSTYSQVDNSRMISGAQAAQALLDANGLRDVPINRINGSALENYFDPRDNSLNLSQEVYNDTSVAAMCIACHEVGHALQHSDGYAPISVRNALVPIVNFTQAISWPAIFIGIVLSSTTAYGSLLFNIGVICFAVVILFHLLTLPVEFNASRRALTQMQEINIVNDADYNGSKKVLDAAAMTYVAALATSIAMLLRVLLMRGRRD